MPSERASTVASFKVMDVLRRANELEAEISSAGADSEDPVSSSSDTKATQQTRIMAQPVLHCEVGQPQTGAPATVAAAAVRALQQDPPQVMGYTDAFGLLPLREKIKQHYRNYYKDLVVAAAPDAADDVNNNHHDTTTTTTTTKIPGTDRIVVTTGSSGAFLLAFTACFDPGDVVAIASSGYPCYRNILSALGCTLANIPINKEFKLTARELAAEIERRRNQNISSSSSSSSKEPPIRGLILSSPGNPTGAMLTPTELQELCALCDAEGIQFLSDEIYHGISYGKPEATALQYSDRAIVINSFSKYYSMSGWRLGWMVVPDFLVDPINRLQQNMFINAPTISQTAALQCWEPETLAILEAHVEKYRESRAILLRELSIILADDVDPQNIAPSDGGFYVYIDVGETNVARSATDTTTTSTTTTTTTTSNPNFGTVGMCQALLEEEHVAFTPGIDFEDPSGSLGDRRFRISYAGGTETAREAMVRFGRFWPTWRERVRQHAKQQQQQQQVSPSA